MVYVGEEDVFFVCFPYSSYLALILGVVKLSCIGHTTISGHIFQGRKLGQFWVL